MKERKNVFIYLFFSMKPVNHNISMLPSLQAKNNNDILLSGRYYSSAETQNYSSSACKM